MAMFRLRQHNLQRQFLNSGTFWNILSHENTALVLGWVWVLTPGDFGLAPLSLGVSFPICRVGIKMSCMLLTGVLGT